MIEIVQVATSAHLNEIKRLFQEYAASLGFGLDFQEYEKEFAELPGEYALPHGRLYLAQYDNEIAGCVALRRLEGSQCEMKRMYVRPEFRGKGIGRAMAEKAISEARDIGYTRMRLDTIDTMKPAIALYKSLGFTPIAPYRYNPISGASYMELVL